MTARAPAAFGRPTPKPVGEHRRVYLWGWPLRAMHWLAALSIVVLVVTGFYIGRPYFVVAGDTADHFLMGWIRFVHFVAAAVLAFISFPVTPATSILFGAVMGLLWLSTVAPTNGIIVVMFGTRWLATLAGLAFFSHQVGGFLGVLLGGFAFEYWGSYNPVWWLSVFFGVLSALINLPIVEKPVLRAAGAPA